MKKAILIPILILFLIICSGCTSKEAKEVINGIDSLGEITLESYSYLNDLNSKYNALSDEDKQDVDNYKILEEANSKYNQLKYADINSRIETASQTVTASSLSELEELKREYDKLSDDGKKQITNYKILEDALIESRQLKAASVIEEIQQEANSDNIQNAKDLLDSNAYLLTDEQITQSLVEIGRWEAVSKAEDYFKDFLKSPSSYKRYQAACYVPSLQEDDTYRVQVQLKYGATNSFNAEVTDTVELYVYYKIDIDKLTINYTDTQLTAYYQWKLYS